MKKAVIGFCIISVLFTMCKEQKENDDSNEFSLLFGKTFVLHIDRVAQLPDIQFPSDNLKESDYTLTNEEIQFDIVFSENGQAITIEPGTIRGKKINDDDNCLRYELDEGVSAGGRFVLWINQNDIEVEYTIYGSGVPIIKSQRGILVETLPAISH
jgi:hypothetical protein